MLPEAEAKELSALARLAKALAAASGFGAQIEALSEALPILVPLEWGRLFVRRDQEATLDERVVFVPSGGWREADPEMRERVRLGEGVVGGVAASGVPTVLAVTEEGDESASKRSRLVLPAVFRGKVLAVLEVVATRHAPEDRSRLECLTAHLASAMMNEELIERERTARDLRRAKPSRTEDASVDSLTGLMDRRRFEVELLHFLERSQLQQIPAALLCLDIDHFKVVNEAVGHDAGDELLRQVARQIEAQLRLQDLVARWGGDAFTILISGSGAEQAETIAGRLVDAVKGATLRVGGRPVEATVSIGVALVPQHGSTRKELLAHADLALHRAKEQGRNRWCLFAPEERLGDEAEASLEWGIRLREALEEEQFVLFSQADRRSAE